MGLQGEDWYRAFHAVGLWVRICKEPSCSGFVGEELVEGLQAVGLWVRN